MKRRESVGAVYDRASFVAPLILLVLLALAPAAALAQQEQKRPEAGKGLGMSILGNQEAPKALVIVPWKRSELGAALGITTMLDDSKRPIDKEVFMRMLSYYEIRSNTARSAGPPVNTDASPSDAGAQRRKQ